MNKDESQFLLRIPNVSRSQHLNHFLAELFENLQHQASWDTNGQCY